jgi:D-psicose/D-tagatose/L-ribulose 3-epimerase
MDNRLGIYYGYFMSGDTADWNDILSRARNAGLETVELSAVLIKHESKAIRESIAEYAEKLSLSINFSSALPLDGDISSDSMTERRRGIESLKRDIQLCSEMKGKKISGVLYCLHKKFPDVETRKRMFENSVISLKEVAATASDYGIVLCCEVVNRFESPIINTAEEGVKLAQCVGSPALGVHLDTFHMHIEEDDPYRAIINTGKYLKHFHVCENNRKLPGKAQINWKNIFSALSKAGYDGDIVIESLPFPYGSVTDRLNIWRRLIDNDVDADLRESVCFLKSLLKETE